MQSKYRVAPEPLTLSLVGSSASALTYDFFFTHIHSFTFHMMKTLYSAPLLCVLSLFSAKSYAQALDPTHIYKIVEPASGQVLEIGGDGDLLANGTSNDNTVKADLWGYWGGANQQWVFRPTFSSTGIPGYTIVNKNSGKALCVPQVTGPTSQWRWQDQCGSSYARRIVSQQTIGSGLDNQVWFVQPQGGTSYNLVLASYPKPIAGNAAGNQSGQDAHEQLCLDLTVYLDKTGPSVQPWQIIDVGTNNSSTYVASNFQIINNNSGKALRVNTTDNRVVQYTAWGITSQEWTFSAPNANGYVQITNRGDKRVLEIGGGGDITLPGVQADVWGNWNGLNQQWALLDINDSHILTLAEALDGRSFKMWNPNSGKVLEIGNGGTNDWNTANQWYDFSHPWQQWHVQLSSYNRTASTKAPTLAQSAARPTSTGTAPANTGVELYPNPAHDILRFTSASVFDPASVKVTDIRGAAANAIYQDGRIDVSSLAAGVYIITVSDGQKIYHRKFVKE